MSRVLIVDDNKDAADALSELVELSGHESHAAYDPTSALEWARESHFDVALLDLDLPQMDGVALGRTLRRIRGGKHVRLIAITGQGSLPYRFAALKAGFERYLLKPADPDDIREAVDARPALRAPSSGQAT